MSSLDQIYAALDLGSNSFHLLIAKYCEGEIITLERYSDKVQFGRGLVRHSNIDRAAMARGLTCLKSFQAHIRRYPDCEIKCYGTQALRRAKNASLFLEQAKSMGFDIAIIKGKQEARLVYSGANVSLPETEKKRLVIDIGGGSTEFALGQGKKLLEAYSIPIGAISWREAYFESGDIRDNYWEFAAKEVRRLLKAGLSKNLREADEVYVTSGTAKMLQNICLDNRLDEQPIDFTSLNALKKLIWSYQNTDDVVLAGLKPHRRDLLVPGLVIMKTIMEYLNLSHVSYCPTALREGMLLEMIYEGR